MISNSTVSPRPDVNASPIRINPNVPLAQQNTHQQTDSLDQRVNLQNQTILQQRSQSKGESVVQRGVPLSQMNPRHHVYVPQEENRSQVQHRVYVPVGQYSQGRGASSFSLKSTYPVRSVSGGVYSRFSLFLSLALVCVVVALAVFDAIINQRRHPYSSAF